MTDIPALIFVHKGFPLYFRIALEHACITQKDSRIIVLTDNPSYKEQISPEYKERIEFYSINDYFSSACKFEPLYIHMSPNTKEFELICFQRWFAIMDFVNRQNNINSFFCCDSDNLVYSNLTEIAVSRMNDKEIAITNHICPNCTFFTKKSIKIFCNYIIDQYSNENNLQRLKTIYEEKKKENGGICDMTMFDLFQSDNPEAVHDFGTVQDEHVFDNQFTSHVGFHEEYMMTHGRKKVSFVNGIPKGMAVTNGNKKSVYFDVLHFQGWAKAYMSKYSFVSKKIKKRFEKENFSSKRFLQDLTPDFVRKIYKILLHR
ncbi:MAG: hypothetical protein KBT21_11415 [Treponema sp.]|nr:hypothetical protein [Candidatus Treponema merdequi]